MIPVLRSGDREIRIGPFLLDAGSGRLSASPWPEWLREVFPLEWYMEHRSIWSPYRYCSTVDGGIWAIRRNRTGDMEPDPGMVVICLDGEGGLRSAIQMPEPDLQLFGPMVFGEWAFVAGHLLKGSSVIRRETPPDPQARSAIEFHRASLGPGGEILFPDGRIQKPDGTVVRWFDQETVLSSARRRAGLPASRYRFDEAVVLGWEDRRIWMDLVFRDDRELLRQVHVISEISPAWQRGLSVQHRAIAGHWDGFRCVHLPDGGWVLTLRKLEIHNGPEANIRERWVFRLPGRDDVVEHDPVTGEKYVSFQGMEFFFLGETGLVALVDGRMASGERHVLLWAGDGREGHVLPVFRSGFHELSMFFHNGWTVLRRGDQEMTILFPSRHRIDGVPPEAMIFPDIGRIVPHRRPYGSIPGLVILWKDLIVTMWCRRGREMKDPVFLSFPADRKGTSPIHRLRVPGELQKIFHFSADERMILLCSTRLPFLDLAIDVGPDGSIDVARIA